jgi:NAD(P)-dependent dehydrogenase (short-subunit alcohol dehydrogenase family)
MQRTILITGASRGIGAATARLAAERGYAVAINYVRDESSAIKLKNELEKTGARAIVLPGDVSIEMDVIRMFEAVDRSLGRLTALVNNAGIVDVSTRVENMTAARLQRMLAVNVIGSFLCAREAIKRMAPRFGGEGGAIVNISSAAAKLGSPGDYVDYAASKGAIETFTIGLAKEVATDRIRVNGVRPGVIRTEIHATSGDPSRVDRIGKTAPLARAGEPEEVARAIVWLLSDEASYTTGTMLDVTGGR